MSENNQFMNHFSLVEEMPDEGEFISLLSSEEEEVMNNETLPESISLLPLKNMVLYPGVVIPITVGRDKSIKLIKDAYKKEKLIGVVAQKSELVEDPEVSDLYEVGTLAKIMKLFKMPDGNTTVIIQGIKRFKIVEFLQKEPYFKVTGTPIEDEPYRETNKIKASLSALRDTAISIIELSPNIPTEATVAIKNIDSPKFLVNFISSNLNANIEEKQILLEITNFEEAMQQLLKYLNKDLQLLQLKQDINSRVRVDLDKQQRDYFLQQQLKVINEELGYGGYDKELSDMILKAEKKQWAKQVKEHFDKELGKIQRMNPASAEYSVVFNYLELLLDLPWGEYTKDKIDLDKAKKVLDKDHYGLEKIKDRILEYLAVLKLKGDMKSPILCLYGPPGVGKTSLGKSIAKSMGRTYTRISLGGLHDESEIRGHRKTYIGAMPGRIIQALKKAKTSNPVIVLDEIDKIGSSMHGDPASALLEVLDPEQNSNFYDNYVELDYDLSKVMFIATANSLDTIHPALRDRLEIIEISGYLLEEKIEIAKSYLVPKQRELHGLKPKDIKIEKEIIENIIDSYTRESGVRGLEKKIASLARYRAKEIVGNQDYDVRIKQDYIAKVLGPQMFEKETMGDLMMPGVATGLAWTPVGGDVLFIECVLTKGDGKLTLTGKLGDVMKESAITALTYLKTHFADFNLSEDIFKTNDIHIHVPEGAVPKDGPSAGITMFTALASAFTKNRVKKNFAMTGETTLRGKVLPVGGIKEKILAAKRFMITDIVMSKQNKKDVLDIKETYIKGLKFHYVETLEEVVRLALEK
jgi:ATP-dependent Lon protease